MFKDIINIDIKETQSEDLNLIAMRDQGEGVDTFKEEAEPSRPIKSSTFVDQLRNYHRLKKSSASYFMT